VQSRSEDPVIPQLVVLLAEKGGVLMIALSMEGREEDEEV
jgi:hypothetical protein